jgi:CubicO group peptidase (beta-lactamase class C family)
VLTVETDPAAVGLDPARLARLDARLARWVDEGQLPGFLVTVARHGDLAHVGSYGHRDVAAGLPVTPDTIWRIFSMTKPVTSVAAMSLYEEGAFELTDPISRWLPEFAEPRVYVAGSSARPVTEPATEPIRVWHLLTHTSGLTYGFHHTHPVDAMYRAAGHEWGTPPGADSAEVSRQWAALPLVFQPGSEWNYGVSTDVLGRFVEVVAGKPLDEVFAERVFTPLGMTETSFGLRPDDDPALLARLYGPGLAPLATFEPAAKQRPAFLSGGGGLVSTAGDYLKFVEMLRAGGATPDGGRVLGSRTVAHMVRNHIPGGADLEAYGRPLFAETPLCGVGFGLGFSMVLDPARYGTVASVGDYSWGGAASTAFYVDPVEDLTVTFYTQLLPSSTLPIRGYLRSLVHQALV